MAAKTPNFDPLWSILELGTIAYLFPLSSNTLRTSFYKLSRKTTCPTQYLNIFIVYMDQSAIENGSIAIIGRFITKSDSDRLKKDRDLNFFLKCWKHVWAVFKILILNRKNQEANKKLTFCTVFE